MKAFHLTVLVVVAVILYGGLGVLFYDEETGFSWFGRFMLITVAVLGLFVWLMMRDLRKIRGEEEKKEEESSKL